VTRRGSGTEDRFTKVDIGNSRCAAARRRSSTIVEFRQDLGLCGRGANVETDAEAGLA